MRLGFTSNAKNAGERKMNRTLKWTRPLLTALLAVALTTSMGVQALALPAPPGAEPSPTPSGTSSSSGTDAGTETPTPQPSAAASASPQPTPAPLPSEDPGTDPAPTAGPAPSATLPAEPEVSSEAAAGQPTTGEQAIKARWLELGGETGVLGAAQGAIACGLAADGCHGEFAKGSIAWSSALGAKSVRGTIALRWAQLGSLKGGLGYPTNEEKCGLSGGGCRQTFQGGAVYYVPNSGTFEVWNGIAARWTGLGAETGPLGYPTGVEKCGLRNGACMQPFQWGAMYYVPGVGTNPVMNAILARWTGLGAENGALGYPTGIERCGLAAGGCVQTFQNGGIFYAPGVGTNPVMNAILARWSALGAENGALGYPVETEKCGLAAGGCQQAFQGGAIYYAASAGTHAISGAFYNGYRQRGGPSSALGYPVADESCWAGSCRQEFQYGTYTWSSRGALSSSISPWGYCASLGRGAAKYPHAGAARVSFAVAQSYGSTSVNFVNCVRQSWGYSLEWAARGADGESGFARPGVATGPTTGKFSPTGSFSVTEAFGLSNPGTALPYRTLNPYSRWGGRLNSNYNKYFESSADIFPDENMWYYATRRQGDYRQGAVINYNRPPDAPITMNAGFAIFLHANPVGTWGCIALAESDVIRYLRSAAPGDRLIMGVDADVFR